MGRQGKMHSSPFHVESARYKYAVEHELENYAIQSIPVKCVHRSRESGHCNLWNIKYSSCTPHRCKYYNSALQRTSICSDCAYFYDKKCFHPKRPIRSGVDIDEARYCGYFHGIENGSGFFRAIRNSCKRISLTELTEKYRKKIHSKTLFIRRANEELSNPNISADNKEYLEAKIEQKTAERLDAVKMFKRYLAELSAAGGKLDSIPSQLFLQKSKSKRKAKHCTK